MSQFQDSDLSDSEKDIAHYLAMIPDDKYKIMVQYCDILQIFKSDDRVDDLKQKLKEINDPSMINMLFVDAVMKGKEEYMIELYLAGADVNYGSSLQIANERNHIDISNFLIASNATFSEVDIQIATNLGHHDILRSLLLAQRALS